MSVSFVVFVLLAIAAPGAGLQRWARLRVDLALVLPLGGALAALTYWLSLASGRPWLFPLALATASAGLLARRTRPVDPGLTRALGPAIAALVALLAVTQYRWNRPAPDGGFLLDPMGDQPLHAGIAWELTLPYPPQVPGLAGIPLSYHVGADLVRAAAQRWAGVEPYALLNREEPTLWAIALMLALAGLARRLGGSPLAVALAPWTVLLADFSFICALVPDTRWWSDTFRSNLLISLAFANPVVPALALALGCLIALHRHESGEGRAWLGLAVLQAAAVPWFKVFLGAQLALSFALAALLIAWTSRSADAPPPGAWWRRAAVAVLLAAVAGLALLPLVLGGTGEQVEVVVAPLRMVGESLRDVGMGGMGRGLAASGSPAVARRLAGSSRPRPAGRVEEPLRREGGGDGRRRTRAVGLAARPSLSRRRSGRRGPRAALCHDLLRRAVGGRAVGLHRDRGGGVGGTRAPAGSRHRRRRPAVPALDPRVRGAQGAGRARLRARRGRPGPGRDRPGRPSGRRGPPAPGRALPAAARRPRRPPGGVRALHALPDPVRSAPGAAPPPREAAPLLPDVRPRTRRCRSRALSPDSTCACTEATGCASTPRASWCRSTRRRTPALTGLRRSGLPEPGHGPQDCVGRRKPRRRACAPRRRRAESPQAATRGSTR